MRKKIKLFSVFFLMLISFAKAQETTSEIQGIIADSKGSPIAGATIIAVHTPTGTSIQPPVEKTAGITLQTFALVVLM
jgi:hypothetical protein